MASILDELKNKYPESEDMGKANNIAEGVAAIPVSGEVPEEASFDECRVGRASDKYVSPKDLAWGVFYGLADAAGDASQKSSGTFGLYTDDAQLLIKTMMGLDDILEGQICVEISESDGTYSASKTFSSIMQMVNDGKTITARFNGQLSASYLVNLQVTIPVIYFTFIETDTTATNLNVYRIAVYASGTVEKEATKHVELTT